MDLININKMLLLGPLALSHLRLLSALSVREGTALTELPPLDGEIIAHFLRIEGSCIVSVADHPRP
jgi:hypothetical protein